MLPKIRADFCITGIEIPPDKITSLLGISPTKTWQVGESIQGTALKRKFNGWCISKEYERDLNLVKPVKSLLEILLPKSKVINHICNEYKLECEMSCVIYVTDETPIIDFEQDVISKLAELKTTLDIDIILTRTSQNQKGV